MPFIRPPDMISATPLPGWSGRFLHSANMTFAHYDLAPGQRPCTSTSTSRRRCGTWSTARSP